MPPSLEELQAQMAEMQEKVTDLTASNTALNAKNRELLAEKKGWGTKRDFLADKLGIKLDDEDAIEQAAELLEAARNPDPGKKPAGGKDDKQVEKLRAQMAEEIAKREKDAKAWQGRFESALLERELAEAIGAENGIPDLLLPMLRAQVRVVQDGDTFRAQVVDSDGNERLAGAKPMTTRQLVAGLKADDKFGGAFKSSGASGSGSTSSGQRPNTGEKSSLDKIKAGLATLR